MQFRIAPHTFRPGGAAIEVLDDGGKLLAAIYGSGPRELKIVSKYLTADGIVIDATMPPALIVKLAED